jgi:hypothetical protein
MKKKNLLLIAVASIGLTTATVAQTVPSYVPTNGLVGWWPFNGNAIDESINTNDGTVNGATLTADRFGNANKAYNFDGVNNFISLSGTSSINFAQGVTFSAWINANDLRMASLVDKEYGCVSYGYRLCIRTNGELWAEHGCYGSAQTGAATATASSYQVNSWLFIVGTLDPITGKNNIFLNGNLINSVNISQMITNTKTIEIGRVFSPLTYEFFNGKIDDIGIWNRALTQQEITALYNGANVGINDISIENQFSIFPNPAQNVITLKATTKLDGSVYSIYDNIGRVVASGKLNGENTMVELGHLAAGIYILRVGDNLKQTFKIVKE